MATVDFPASELELSVGARFSKIVERFPNRLAVRHDREELTYGELAAAVSGVARRLDAELGPPASAVVSELDPGVAQIVEMLGIITSGRTLIPVDAAAPRPPVDDGALKAAMGTSAQPGADTISHVIFTSGSTGKPKGVLRTHRNLLQNARSHATAVRLRPEDRHSLVYRPDFEAAFSDTFSALLTGASVHIYDVRNEGVVGFADWVDEHAITVMHSAPTFFRTLAEALPAGGGLLSMRAVVVGGEPVLGRDVEIMRSRFASSCRLYNKYSVTELPGISYYEADGTERGPETLPVGRCSDGVEIVLVDEQGAEVEPGGVGEIVLRSRYLSPGYLGDPDLTAKAFSVDPHGDGVRRYRTGDIGRRRDDGIYEHRGRKPGRLMIRGYTVQTSEVETALMSVAGVRAAAVTARPDPSGEARLVAYWIAGDGPQRTPAELRRELGAALPSYLVPSVFIELESFPLTTRGKLDRDALPPPDATRPDVAARLVAPRNATEEAMTRLWTDLLGVSPIGIDDDFLELGGHSLLAARLLVRVREAFGVALPLRSLFDHPTVAQLCRLIEEGSAAAVERPPLRRAPRDQPQPLSFSQEAIWRFSGTDVGRLGYNVTNHYRLRGSLDETALAKALAELVARHEALRMAIVDVEGRPFQHAAGERLILGTVDASRSASELARVIDAEATTPFDLTSGPLMRSVLVHLGPQEHELVLTLHHIAFDADAMAVLLEELAALYNAYRDGRSSTLADPPLQAMDHAVWERDWLAPGSDAYDSRIEFWIEELVPRSPSMTLDFRRRRRRRKSKLDGGFQRHRFSSDAVAALDAICERHSVTPYMGLLGVFLATLAAAGDQTDLTIGTHLSTRTQPGLERVVGFLLNLVPLRVDLDGDPSMSQVLDRTRAAALRIADRAEVPLSTIASEFVRRGLDMPEHHVTFQYAPPFTVPSLDGLEVERSIDPRRGQAWGLEFSVRPSGDGLDLAVSVNTDLYDPDGVMRFVERYRTALALTSQDPDCRLSELRRRT